MLFPTFAGPVISFALHSQSWSRHFEEGQLHGTLDLVIAFFRKYSSGRFAFMSLSGL